jgi:MerR family transcriptional regulator, light-induced transcriptional regulator
MKSMNESFSDGVYYIQQVAEITGLSKQLIRKWEERYQLVHPKRLDNGYRIYNDEDINILLTVKALTEQGHSVRQAALFAKTENLSTKIEVRHERILTHEHETMNDYVLQLLQNGTHCNEQGMSFALQQAYHHFGLERFIKSVTIPFLKEVGHRWENKQWSEYQEGLASLVVRDFLIQIRRNFQYKDNSPLLLGACLPNEQHEVPLYILLLQTMLKGWKTIVIGASPAPGSIESIVENLKPKKVLLSATTTIPFIKDPQLLEKLDHFASIHENIDFYLGGPGTFAYTSGMQLSSIQITNDIEDVLNDK